MALYAQSTATLKTILSHPSLQRDTIDATMDALADANADAKDIDETIRNGATIASGDPYDDAELEEELQHLLREKEEESSKGLQDKMDKHTVPSHLPSSLPEVQTEQRTVPIPV